MANFPRVVDVGFDALAEPQENGCILWMAGKTLKGYGEFRIKGQRWYAHRFAWTRTNGAIPDGMHVLHRCDTPACVNPAHLFLGTNADNHADKMAKGRQRGCRAGVDNHNAKLNPERVKLINFLRSLGATQVRIAEIVGVARTTVKAVLLGQTWKSCSAAAAQ